MYVYRTQVMSMSLAYGHHSSFDVLAITFR